MALDPAYLLALPRRITRQSYSQRDTILYALGVGVGHDPDRADELKFVYEEGLQALPGMAVVLAYPGFWQREPQYGIDWKQLLHGEQSVELHAQIPIEGAVRGETTIDAIIDKGAVKGALMYTTRRIFLEPSGTLLATVKQVSFLRGNGGCGSSTTVTAQPHGIPDRAPDDQVVLTTRPEQALLYRLSGDYNPLHANPTLAQQAGLPKPLLHGLCTYGIAIRALLRLVCDNEPRRMKRIDCRFTAPVYPGDTLDIAVWLESPGRVAFRAFVHERDALVIDNGYAEFESI